MGVLQIPIGTYHRSQSGREGSIVLNQANRDEFLIKKRIFTSQLKIERTINESQGS